MEMPSRTFLYFFHAYAAKLWERMGGNAKIALKFEIFLWKNMLASIALEKRDHHTYQMRSCDIDKCL